MSYLKVIKNQENISDSGVAYIRSTFRPVKFNENTGVAIPASAEFGTRTFFPGSEPMAGEIWAGEIKHFDTTPYMIGEREVETVKVVVFETEVALDVANNLLERNNACVILNGKETKKLNKVTRPATEPVDE